MVPFCKVPWRDGMKRPSRWILAGVFPVVLWIVIMVWSKLTPAPTNLGVSQGHLAPCPESPNCVSSQAQATDTEHRVDAFELNGNAADAIELIADVIRDMPRTRIVEQTPTYLRAEFRSLVFRFIDDVEFYASDRDQVMHVRSASRLGHSDLGANRKRVELLRQKYSERLAARGG